MVEYTVHRLRHIDVWCRVECWSFFDAHIFHMLRLLSKIFTFTWLSTKSTNPTHTHIISCKDTLLFFCFSLNFPHIQSFLWVMYFGKLCAVDFRRISQFLLSPHISFNAVWNDPNGIFYSLLLWLPQSPPFPQDCPACDGNRIGYKWLMHVYYFDRCCAYLFIHICVCVPPFFIHLSKLYHSNTSRVWFKFRISTKSFILIVFSSFLP